MTYKGYELSFSDKDVEYFPVAAYVYVVESLRMCAHQLVVTFGDGCRLVADKVVEEYKPKEGKVSDGK